MSILAKRAMSARSGGSVGQNSSTKFNCWKMFGDFVNSSRVSGLMKLIAGAGFGAGLPRNAERGCTL
jgi:hypothetical protein